MTNASTRRAAVAAVVVAVVLALAGTAVAAVASVTGSRVAAHDHLAAAVVAATEDVLAGQGRAATTGAAKEVVGSRVAPQTAVGASTDLVRVADFAEDATAFSHYSKHVRGIEFRPNGGYRLKPGGADMPEFGSFAEYRGAARSFMGPDAPSGVLQGYRGTDLLRVDPKTGYFGVRSQSGTVRTFFRPDGDPVAYFWGQL